MGEQRVEVAEALRRSGIAEVDDSRLARALYSSDASLYRVPPLAVVRPRHRDEVEAVLAVCRDLAVPVTARGAGTSIAGNAIGPGIVIDYSRHLGEVLDLDPQAMTARVQPGTVHATLQAAAQAHGLRFGPDPSTHSRCTVGGMVGNNACGARALGYGRTSDNVLGLDLLTASGSTVRLGEGAEADSHPLTAAARSLAWAESDLVGREFGRFGRQISGYALEHLLDDDPAAPARFVVGSEGTLGLVQEVTVRLVRDAPHRLLVLLGFPDIASAADAAPAALTVGPTACEGLDRRILAPLLAHGRQQPSSFPIGQGLLMVELAGDSETELRSRAAALIAVVGPADARVVTDSREAAALWRIREDGAGLAARSVDGGPAYAGWEDAAVPPHRLGAYLRDFDDLLGAHRLRALPYGHFGDGCVHVRIDFPFVADGDGGRGAFRSFLDDAARLVASHGGSLSGEHGDGRARSALLGAMYSPAAVDLQGRVKALFDPDGLLNPGVLVDPAPPDEALRTSTSGGLVLTTPTQAWADADAFTAAAHLCTGVGKCRSTQPETVMCPSYRVTREEKDSTRGRARVLQELAQAGSRLTWDSPEVTAALDLCLSCKACSTDCPTGVDVARLKSEVLHQRYAGRRRPLSHHTLGRLPRWADLAARAPRVVNAVTQGRLAPVVARIAGIDSRRPLPAFAERTFLGGGRRRPRSATGPASSPAPGPPTAPALPASPNGPVLLWVDTFTDHFAPQVAEAAVRVLGRAGYDVRPVTEPVCCGLTSITTGRLGEARRTVGHTVSVLAAASGDGIPIVGLEPSCLAVLRSDATHLLPEDPDAARVAAAVRTLAQLLMATPGWVPPDLTGVEVVAQPHCHQYAVVGWAAEAELLAAAGAHVAEIRGCCGLAGNWGVEPAHHDLSVAIAESALLPAVRALAPDGVVLADGFSCRTQVDHLSTRRATHLAELLDRG